PEVEKKILDAVKAGGKPAVLGFIGGEAKSDSDGVFVCRELEETAAVAAALANGQDGAAARDALYAEYDALKQQAEKIGKRKGYLRGLYSGGTLCYEGQLVARGILGPIWSNTPLDASKKLADSLKSVEHTMVDYGEDEFTQGRLHPMIDVSLRADRILEEAKDPGVGVILLDVVLGYGCNDDPATGLAEGIRKARKVAGERIAFVASICGVDTDPQNASRQREILEELGVHVCESNARAARLAAMLVEVAQ
ncbi:MAG TPA: fatty-acid metabolism regulator protein, partial [Synergistales bacterium]|nr:fatty-acid metabolism regulator protein [Synergistales bacterium]